MALYQSSSLMPGFLAMSSVPNAAEAWSAESQELKGTGSMGALLGLASRKYWIAVGTRVSHLPWCGLTRL